MFVEVVTGVPPLTRGSVFKPGDIDPSLDREADPSLDLDADPSLLLPDLVLLCSCLMPLSILSVFV